MVEETRRIIVEADITDENFVADGTLSVDGSVHYQDVSTDGKVTQVTSFPLTITADLSLTSFVYIPSTPSEGQILAWDATTGRFEVVAGTTINTDTGAIAGTDIDTDTGDIATLSSDAITAGTATINDSLIFTPSSVVNITAGGGITPTKPIMNIQGSGGDVTVSANPQVAAGVDGQLLWLVGANDAQHVTLNTGNGLHLHGEIVLHEHDAVLLVYDEGDSIWEELARNIPINTLTTAFQSRQGSSGTTYAKGFYVHAAGNDLSPAVNLGTANISYAAHVYVVLGATTVDELQITVSGTSITDAGVRTGSDSEVITIPSATDPNAYYETAKKWIGQVTLEATSGTPKNCNYGFAKYYDNNNNDFTVVGVEATGRGGANDGSANIGLRHHKATGWTYNAGGAIPPAYLVDMNTDHTTEINIGNGLPFAWKRANVSTIIRGSASEGIIWEIVTSANATFEQGNLVLTYTAK